MKHLSFNVIALFSVLVLGFSSCKKSESFIDEEKKQQFPYLITGNKFRYSKVENGKIEKLLDLTVKKKFSDFYYEVKIEFRDVNSFIAYNNDTAHWVVSENSLSIKDDILPFYTEAKFWDSKRLVKKGDCDTLLSKHELCLLSDNELVPTDFGVLDCRKISVVDSLGSKVFLYLNKYHKTPFVQSTYLENGVEKQIWKIYSINYSTQYLD